MSEPTEIIIGASRGSEDDNTTVVVYNAIMGLLGMLYESPKINDGIIMSALFQACGTLAAQSTRSGSGTIEQWHQCLDKAIELADLNAMGPRQGDVS
jgi:hypothetical protein